VKLKAAARRRADDAWRGLERSVYRERAWRRRQGQSDWRRDARSRACITRSKIAIRWRARKRGGSDNRVRTPRHTYTFEGPHRFDVIRSAAAGTSILPRRHNSDTFVNVHTCARQRCAVRRTATAVLHAAATACACTRYDAAPPRARPEQRLLTHRTAACDVRRLDFGHVASPSIS
jgi:hypothetical protein